MAEVSMIRNRGAGRTGNAARAAVKVAAVLVSVSLFFSCYWSPEASTGGVTFELSREPEQTEAMQAEPARRPEAMPEPSHGRVFVATPEGALPLGATSDHAEFQVNGGASSYLVTSVPPADDYTARVELGIYENDVFSVLLEGDSRSFKVRAGRRANVKINLKRPSPSR